MKGLRELLDDLQKELCARSCPKRNRKKEFASLAFPTKLCLFALNLMWPHQMPIVKRLSTKFQCFLPLRWKTFMLLTLVNLQLYDHIPLRWDNVTARRRNGTALQCCLTLWEKRLHRTSASGTPIMAHNTDIMCNFPTAQNEFKNCNSHKYTLVPQLSRTELQTSQGSNRNSSHLTLQYMCCPLNQKRSASRCRHPQWTWWHPLPPWFASSRDLSWGQAPIRGNAWKKALQCWHPPCECSSVLSGLRSTLLSGQFSTWEPKWI